MLYVDLVKAFDIANHHLLFVVLKTFGVPEHMTRESSSVYTNMPKVKSKLEKEEHTILCWCKTG